jgi:O-antigen/teichoic acid export membrane protein
MGLRDTFGRPLIVGVAALKSLRADGNGFGHIARDTSQVLFSTISIQVATFAILALAGRYLPIVEFSRLSLIVATTMLATTVFDLGLGITATKFFGETRDDSYLRTAFGVWLLLLPVGATVSVLIWFVVGRKDLAVGLALGCALNIWNGVRVADIARQDLSSFTRASLYFAAIRLVAGISALLVSQDAVIVAVCIFLLPIVVTPFSASFLYITTSVSGARKPILQLLKYTSLVQLGALAFVATPYVPQYVIAAHFSAIDVGTYGLIMTFTAPIGLITSSLRSVLLPRMLGPNSVIENRLWSWSGILVVFGLCVLFLAGGVVVGIFVDYIYAARFPGIQNAFVVFYSGFCLTAVIGLYSLSVHTQSVPHYNMIVNLSKLLGLLVLLRFFGHSLMSIVAITSVTMVVAEVLLVGALLVKVRQ